MKALNREGKEKKEVGLKIEAVFLYLAEWFWDINEENCNKVRKLGPEEDPGNKKKSFCLGLLLWSLLY